jgi:hypothetical protein
MSESSTEARRVLDEADARACLDAARAAGLTPHAWARANGVATRSLSRWRERVALVDAQAARSRGGTREAVRAPRVVEVTVTPPPEPAPAARYDVVVGHYRVVVGDNFADTTLARLLRVVASC